MNNGLGHVLELLAAKGPSSAGQDRLWEGFTKDTPDGDWRIDQRMTAQRTA